MARREIKVSDDSVVNSSCCVATVGARIGNPCVGQPVCMPVLSDKNMSSSPFI